MAYVKWAEYLVWHPWDILKRFMESQITAWSDVIEEGQGLGRVVRKCQGSTSPDSPQMWRIEPPPGWDLSAMRL